MYTLQEVKEVLLELVLAGGDATGHSWDLYNLYYHFRYTFGASYMAIDDVVAVINAMVKDGEAVLVPIENDDILQLDELGIQFL